eukprot:gene25110-32750_t
MKHPVPIQHFRQWMASVYPSVVFSDNIRIKNSSFKGFGITVSPNCEVRKGNIVFKVMPKAWLPYSADFAVEVMRVQDAEFLNRIIDISTQMLPHYAIQRKSLVESVCMAFNLIAPYLFQPKTSPDNSANGYIHFLATSGYPYFPGSLPHPIEGPRSLADGDVFSGHFSSPPLLKNSMEIDMADLLSGSQAFVDMEKRRLMYYVIAKRLLGSDARSASARRLFLWGMGKVLSRALSNTHMVNTEGTSDSQRERSSPFSMVPVLDLVNHGNDAEAVNARHVFDCADSSFQLIAERDIPGGEEVLISYGSHRSTSSFVNIYGFAGRSSETNASTSSERSNTVHQYNSLFLNNPGDTVQLSFPFSSERVTCASSLLTFPASASVDKNCGDRRLRVGLPLFGLFENDAPAAAVAEVEQFADAMKANPLSIPEHVLRGLIAFLLSKTDSECDPPRMRVAAVRLFVTIFCNSDASCEDPSQKLLSGIQGAIDTICYAGDKMQLYGFQGDRSQGDSRVGNDFLQHLIDGMNSFRQNQSLLDGGSASFSFSMHDDGIHGSGNSINHDPSESVSLSQWQWNTCAP